MGLKVLEGSGERKEVSSWQKEEEYINFLSGIKFPDLSNTDVRWYFLIRNSRVSDVLVSQNYHAHIVVKRLCSIVPRCMTVLILHQISTYSVTAAVWDPTFSAYKKVPKISAVTRLALTSVLGPFAVHLLKFILHWHPGALMHYSGLEYHFKV